MKKQSKIIKKLKKSLNNRIIKNNNKLNKLKIIMLIMISKTMNNEKQK